MRDEGNKAEGGEEIIYYHQKPLCAPNTTAPRNRKFGSVWRKNIFFIFIFFSIYCIENIIYITI